MGLIHYYYGMGKGKSTTLIGLTIRMLGNEKKVLFVQFLKSLKSSELYVLEGLENIKILRSEKVYPFTYNMNQKQISEIIEINNEIFNETLDTIENGHYDLLVLDEIGDCYSYNYINKDLVLNFFKNKPKDLEIAISGHKSEEDLIDLADYVTNYEKVKHPFDNGVKARKGIEY